MINLIKELLNDDKYYVKEFDTKILIYKGIFPEDYIEIENTAKYIISEVHRDRRDIKIETIDEKEAVIYSVVLVKRFSADLINRETAKNIEDYIKSGQEEKALNIIENTFDVSMFSINIEDSSKISFLQQGDRVDIKYGGEYIAADIPLIRGYKVLYNYCKELEYIATYCNKIENQLNCSINQEKVKSLYIRKMN